MDRVLVFEGNSKYGGRWALDNVCFMLRSKLIRAEIHSQTPHLYDFGIFGRVPEPQKHVFLSLGTPGHSKQSKKNPKSFSKIFFLEIRDLETKVTFFEICVPYILEIWVQHFEILKQWNFATSKLWNLEISKLWNSATLKLQNFETLNPRFFK